MDDIATWHPHAIADHAMVSDGQTGALVHRDGTIDWLCLPHFDSEPCFAALLGNGENGAWWLAPTEEVVRSHRRYRGDTMILETEYETANGSVRVTDFMPAARGAAPDIVRIVEGLSGSVCMRNRMALRFAEGRVHPRVSPVRDKEDPDAAPVLRATALAGPNAVMLDFSQPLRARDGHEETHFTIHAGQCEHFVMTWYPSHASPPDPVDVDKALAETEKWWSDWSRRNRYDGPDRAIVMRSLLAIRGLVQDETGGMLGALTAGLPESPGGARNWDYRFCWLRDATFALLALLRAGYRDEAREWIHWLYRALAGEPIAVQPFYTIDGGRIATEREAPWLEGFAGARPVRFGNGAADQLQLDVYGEAIDALFVARNENLIEDGDLILELGMQLEKMWSAPDDGIWESRGKREHHVYSKAMCWVAFDRVARLLQETGETDSEGRDAGHWRALADTVRAQVLERGFDKDIGAFTQSYGSRDLDAAVLRLPLVGFIDANDPRMLGTVAAIEHELMREGYVWRYKTNGSDGLEGEEGAFLACSSWLVDVYIGQGRDEDARALFDRITASANDLNLLSEEYLPEKRMMLGNFPQVLSHVAVINNAFGLAVGSGRIDRYQRG